MIGSRDLFDVVLYDQASAEYLDVDRHAPAVKRRSCAGGAMSWRARLIFRLGSVKHQAGMSTFPIGALIVAEKLDSTKVLSSIFSVPFKSFDHGYWRLSAFLANCLATIDCKDTATLNVDDMRLRGSALWSSSFNDCMSNRQTPVSNEVDQGTPVGRRRLIS